MATSADTGQGADGTAPRKKRLAAAERREVILRAAAEVFAQAGYRATRVSDVAARVGVTEPVIFQNFGSKAALFAAVLEYAAAQARASLDDLAAAPGSAPRLLAHVLTQLTHGEAPADPGAWHGRTGHPGTGYGVLFAAAAALTAEPELTGPARSALRAVASHLADLIRRAQADGGLDPGTDPDAAAWLLLSVLSARRLRAAAMPPGLEPAVTALALQTITPPAATTRDHAPQPPPAPGRPGPATRS